MACEGLRFHQRISPRVKVFLKNQCIKKFMAFGTAFAEGSLAYCGRESEKLKRPDAAIMRQARITSDRARARRTRGASLAQFIR